MRTYVVINTNEGTFVIMIKADKYSRSRINIILKWKKWENPYIITPKLLRPAKAF